MLEILHVPNELLESEQFSLIVKEVKLTAIVRFESSNIEDSLSHNEWSSCKDGFWNKTAGSIDFDCRQV